MKMLHNWIQNIKKTKRGVWLSILGSLFAIITCMILLFEHLLQIQVPERLRYVKDYNDFTLSVTEVKDCSNQIFPLFQYEDTIYNGICIRDVTVNYGSVKASLEYILKTGYIDFQDIQEKLGDANEKVEHVEYYEYRRSEKEHENYRVTITPKHYQNVVMREVTFERYIKEEIIDENNVKVDGSLDVS